MNDHILVEQDGAIATVVFNRPKMRNAISLAMWSEIATVTETLAKDDSVRAIVYRGAGHEAFASGADISEFQEHRKDTRTALAYGKQTDAAYTAIRVCLIQRLLPASVLEAYTYDYLRPVAGRRRWIRPMRRASSASA